MATRTYSRRLIALGGIGAGVWLAAPAVLRAQAPARTPTPSQTEGPFYPVATPPDSDNDLVLVRGQAARAEGVIAHVQGRVLDREGRPVSGAGVEIWQCDARGLYRHPADRPGQRDGAFQGFGTTISGADGAYTFRTIRPVAYSGRTPHIHFKVRTPARTLTTQMYVAGEPLNEADGLYRRMSRAEREALTVEFGPANAIEENALRGSFDIVL
jgi:protocatechuate 3,4-dioxygenase beta subunit